MSTMRLCVAVGALFLLGAVAKADDTAHGVPGVNVADMKLAQFPGLPTCATGSVQSGDPSKGGSVIYAKMAPGCTIPWHWHTPTETLVIVSGAATVEMKDGKPVTLRAGGFAQMPSNHVHRFKCAAACTLYVSSDAAFDIHYVDADGKEMTPDDALTAVKETAAKPPAQ